MLSYIPLLVTLIALLAPVTCANHTKTHTMQLFFEQLFNRTADPPVEIPSIQLVGINYGQFENNTYRPRPINSSDKTPPHSGYRYYNNLTNYQDFAAALEDLEVITTDFMSLAQMIMSSLTDDDNCIASSWIYSQRKLSQFSLRSHCCRIPAMTLHKHDSGGGVLHHIKDFFLRFLDPDNYRWAPHDRQHKDKCHGFNVMGSRCFESYTIRAIGTMILNYISSEADHFQIRAIPNRLSLYTGPGLELLSVKETYSGWSMKSAILLLCHRHKDSWHHLLSKPGYML